MKKGMIAALSAMAGVVAGATGVWKIKGKSEIQFKEYADKHLAILLLFNQWMITKQEGKSIVTYFKKNGYQEIAVYGMSYVGERLLDELRESDVKVKYAIDKNADNIYVDMDVVMPGEQFEKVDAVVVTSNYYFEEIEESLGKKMDCPILNLEDILYEI